MKKIILLFAITIYTIELIGYTVTIRNLTNEKAITNLTGGAVPTTSMVILPGHTLDIHTAGLCPLGLVARGCSTPSCTGSEDQFWDEDKYSVVQCREGLDWWILRRDASFENNPPLGWQKKGQIIVTRDRPLVKQLPVKLRDGRTVNMQVYTHPKWPNFPISPAYYGNDTNNPRGAVSKCYFGPKIINVQSATDVFAILNDFKNKVQNATSSIKNAFQRNYRKP